MKRVVFVCSGNTCRSPLAAAILRAEEPGVEVLSAGLAAYDGSPAAESARAVAGERGLSLQDHRAQTLRGDLLEGAVCLTMTRSHQEEVRRRFPEAEGRVFSLGAYAGEPDLDVADPVGLGDSRYRETADLLSSLLRLAKQRHGWLYLQLVGLGSDHAGFGLKRELLAALRQEGVPTRDYGTDSAERCDYPDFARDVGLAVAGGEVGAGILICGTGIGMSISANKVHGVRAALAAEGLGAELARRHNDANVICLGARLTGSELAREIALRFLRQSFDGGRHGARVDKIMRLESVD
jgi:ribose 5-phosphate isomerase B